MFIYVNNGNSLWKLVTIQTTLPEINCVDKWKLMVTCKLIMVASSLSHLTQVNFKTAYFCILLSFSTYAKIGAGCYNDLGNINWERGNME